MDDMLLLLPRWNTDSGAADAEWQPDGGATAERRERSPGQSSARVKTIKTIHMQLPHVPDCRVDCPPAQQH
jgi:hypothetical protein